MDQIFNHINNLSEVGLIIVFIIYFIYSIIREFLIRNANNKQSKIYNQILKKLDEQSQINHSILSYLKIVSKKYTEEITENQAKIIISRVANEAALNIISFIKDVIENNNLKNRQDKVKTKIYNYVTVLYNVDKSDLQNFMYCGNQLSDGMEEKWISEVTKIIIEKIYDKDLDTSTKFESSKRAISQKFDDIRVSLINFIDINKI